MAFHYVNRPGRRPRASLASDAVQAEHASLRSPSSQDAETVVQSGTGPDETVDCTPARLTLDMAKLQLRRSKR